MGGGGEGNGAGGQQAPEKQGVLFIAVTVSPCSVLFFAVMTSTALYCTMAYVPLSVRESSCPCPVPVWQ
jgi:hypothetical protein